MTSRLGRWVILLYGVGVYALFLFTFVYAMGFVAGVGVPRGINDGPAASLWSSIFINAGLLSAFAIQHTIMARPAFKRWWTQIVPAPAERSTFVLATCAILLSLYAFWRPLPGVIWDVKAPVLRAVLWTAYAGGWLLVLYASFLIDHFDLFGLRQVWLHWRGKTHGHPGFAMPRLYRMVRNPLMLGFLIAFWSAPTMTAGRLLFALLTTGYILVGVRIEENDLLKLLGEPYRRYRERTPMLLPSMRAMRNPDAECPGEPASKRELA